MRGDSVRDGAWLASIALAALLMLPGRAGAADSAVVLMYHRFGEEGHRSTNIRLEQFDAHLAELQSGAYNVLPLPEIVAAIRDGRDLPDRTIGISIDDAYLSVYTEAWPRLREAGFPFILFVATEAIDRRFPDYMSWDQIRELRDAGVTIGSQTATHLHMPAHSAERNAEDLSRSNARFEAELGLSPRLFAYPFGEAGADLREVLDAAGFEAAFGQHSGPVHGSNSLYYLPRFPLSEDFGDMDRFRLVAGALPIPTSELTPANPRLTENPPLFGFTLLEEVDRRNALSCFASGQGQARVERLGPRVEVRLEKPFPPGRARINCTVPAGDGRWRWLGMQYYVPPSVP